MSSSIPTELKYSKEHEWIRIEDDGTATIGITEHAQELLGDMVYVELPDVDDELEAGEEAGVAESVKAASDVYTPVSGKVVAVNETLEDAPEQVNADPYHDGWMFRLELSDTDELDGLMSAEEYAEFLENEE
ncbi:MAG: glycine cleavage system protein H [Gammaproteobacteria bacterium CG22_combo_CG10-13_8_21_14_all_40_8]|nr:MAG: glycine cleavage system protein H [Gammaproteobacteria bacterium CG22_combo_CG10-13_8_21_14_all_40_8]